MWIIFSNAAYAAVPFLVGLTFAYSLPFLFLAVFSALYHYFEYLKLSGRYYNTKELLRLRAADKFFATFIVIYVFLISVFGIKTPFALFVIAAAISIPGTSRTLGALYTLAVTSILLFSLSYVAGYREIGSYKVALLFIVALSSLIIAVVAEDKKGERDFNKYYIFHSLWHVSSAAVLWLTLKLFLPAA